MSAEPPDDRPLIGVVIVNWNRWADMAACVAAVLASTGVRLRVVVVDNGSTGAEVVQLPGDGTAVQLLRSSVNGGFAHGANLGIRLALAWGAAYVFTLNNDAFVAPDCLAELLREAERDDGLGAVGPKILYAAEPERIWFAGADRNPLLLALPAHGRGQADGPAFNRTRDVTYLCAGAMFIRRAALARVGLFDAGYFMYYEDCDWCQRLLAQGYRLRTVPAARVWHRVAASSGGEGSPAETYHRTRSVFRFLWQQARGPQRPLLLGLRLALVGWRWARARARGETAVAGALRRGLVEGLTAMRTPRRETTESGIGAPQ